MNTQILSKCYKLEERQLREEIRSLLWEQGIAQLLREYAGANDETRALTVEITDKLEKLRPLKDEMQISVKHPVNDGVIYINILTIQHFFEKFGDMHSNYNPKRNVITLKMDEINSENWLSYIFTCLMHEFTHSLQFKKQGQITDYGQKTKNSEYGQIVSDIGYLFNPYEISARVSAADFHFRAFIEASALKPEQLRTIDYGIICNTFKNSLSLPEMETLIESVEALPLNDETANVLFDVSARLSQRIKAKGLVFHTNYTVLKDSEQRFEIIAKLKGIITKEMKKILEQFNDKLEKLWNYLITDYNGNEFRSYYIQKQK